MPWAPNTHLFEAKGGDIMVHLCGITAFVVLGMMRQRPLFMLALAANTAIVVASNRGGMLAYGIGMAVAFAMRPPEARLGRLVYAFVLFLALGILAGPLVAIQDGSRSISVDQIVLNVKSVLGQGDEALDGTKKWRLMWWTKISGRDGPRALLLDRPRLRHQPRQGRRLRRHPRTPQPAQRPHDDPRAGMGVPGAVLWLSMLAVWVGSLFLSWLDARRAGRHRWMALFAFLMAYMLAIHINAAFDVFLEGPMGGIWFWSIFGLGLAARHLHATRPETLEDAERPDDEAPLAAEAGEEHADLPEVPVWGWDGPSAPVPVAAPNLLGWTPRANRAPTAAAWRDAPEPEPALGGWD